MPLFSSHQEPASDRNGIDEAGPQRKGSIFNRSRSPLSETDSTNTARSRGSFFARHSVDGFNMHKDPSIIAARQRITDAESAEKAADRALHQAKQAVREAREHVKHIEREAIEE